MEFIPNIVNPNGSINIKEFHFNGYDYKIIGTESKNEEPIWLAKDIIKRSDGRIMKMSRHILRDYFAGKINNLNFLKENIEILNKGRL